MELKKRINKEEKERRQQKSLLNKKGGFENVPFELALLCRSPRGRRRTAFSIAISLRLQF